MKKNLLNLRYLTFALVLFVFTGASAQFEDVIVRENLYSESGSGSLYRCTSYNVFTTDLDYLDTIMVEDDIDLLNIYYNDGTANQFYSLHGISGKSLKAIFNGDNDESQIVDIMQLRDNYNEWFILDDGTVSLINLNLVAKHSFMPNETVVVTDSLFNTNDEETQYNTTAYYVKAVASMSDLDNFIVSDSADWISVYIKNQTGTNDPYIRRDITSNVAGESLKTILEANNLTVDSLYFDYKEWFKDTLLNTKLVKLNIKAIHAVESKRVVAYANLYATGAHDLYKMTAYKVKQTATLSDLTNIIIPASTTDFVSIYKTKLIGYERIDVTITSDISLENILLNNGIDIADLKDNYYEWFSTEDFTLELLNINIKAVKILGTLPAVTMKDSLYNAGSSDYRNTIYYINSNATLSDLANYTLTGDAGLNVYLKASDGSDSTLNISGTAGKTLEQVFNENSISISQLRDDYREWFMDNTDSPVLEKLNVKEKTVITDAEKIIVTPNLYSREGASLYENISYYVKTSAEVDDLDSWILPFDIEWLDVYCNVAGVDTAYKITGVAGNTLKMAISAAGNNEGIDIDFNTIKYNNVQWFKNENNQWVLLRVNIKSSKYYSPASINENPINNMTINMYPNPVKDILYVSFANKEDFTYSIYDTNGKLLETGDSVNQEAGINVSSLNKGMYILKIKIDNDVFTTKFVK